MESQNKSLEVLNGAESRRQLVVRVVVLGLTMAAAILVGVDKQHTTVQMKLVDSLPPVNVPVVAKWHYSSAFVFFVVANAIACAYTAISLLLVKSGRRTVVGLVAIVDLIMVALLFASIGATTAIGMVGIKGNSHLRWNKVCNVFGKFCNQVIAGDVLSLIASTLLLLLNVLYVLRLHKKTI